MKVTVRGKGLFLSRTKTLFIRDIKADYVWICKKHCYSYISEMCVADDLTGRARIRRNGAARFELSYTASVMFVLYTPL